MMREPEAQAVRDELESLLPEVEITAVPWAAENKEWIVTVWDKDGGVLADVFRVGIVGAPEYLLRRAGRGPVIGCAASVADIPSLLVRA